MCIKVLAGCISLPLWCQHSIHAKVWCYDDGPDKSLRCLRKLQEAMSRVVGALAHAGATRSLTDAEQQLFSAACKTATKVSRTSLLCCA